MFFRLINFKEHYFWVDTQQSLPYKFPDMGRWHIQYLLFVWLLASYWIIAALDGGLSLCDTAHRNKQMQRSQEIGSHLGSYHFCKKHYGGIIWMEWGNWISRTTWAHVWALAKTTVLWNHFCDGTTLERQVHTALLKQKNSQLIQLLAMNKSSVTINIHLVFSTDRKTDNCRK